MKLAYHISVHHKPYQFKWLFDAIYDPRDIFAIHIDKKSPESVAQDVRDIVGDRPNVIFGERLSVIYGEWALCQVELNGIRDLLEEDAEWDYFINLSGQDYPLKSRDEIVEDLSHDVSRNYVNLIPLETLPAYFRRRRNWACFRIGDTFVRTPIPLRVPRGMCVNWHGSAWHILSRAFCEWLFEAESARRAMQFLHHVKLPNEFLMQTILMNSEFKDTLQPNYKRQMRWRHHSPHPETLTRGDLPMLVDSDAFFARKFDAEVDEEVLRKLANRL